MHPSFSIYHTFKIVLSFFCDYFYWYESRIVYKSDEDEQYKIHLRTYYTTEFCSQKFTYIFGETHNSYFGESRLLLSENNFWPSFGICDGTLKERNSVKPLFPFLHIVRPSTIVVSSSKTYIILLFLLIQYLLIYKKYVSQKRFKLTKSDSLK